MRDTERVDLDEAFVGRFPERLDHGGPILRTPVTPGVGIDRVELGAAVPADDWLASGHDSIRGAVEDGPSSTAILGERIARAVVGGGSVLSREGRVVTTLPQAGVETPRKVRGLPVTYPHGSTGTSYGWG